MIDYQDFRKFLTIKKALSPNSVRLVLSRIPKFLAFSKEVSPQSAESFLYQLKEKGLKNNSINTYIFSLKMLNAYFNDRGISVNLGNLAVLPKTQPEIDILTPLEIKRLLETDLNYGMFRGRDMGFLNEKNKCLTKFLALTGCRFEEATSLLVKRVDLGAGYVTFVDTKNKTNRRVGLAPDLVKDLAYTTALDGEALVFTNALNHKVHPQDFLSDLKRRSRKALISKSVYPHLLRHSFATQLIIQGADVTEVASILGHKDIQTTFQNYVHLADVSLKKAMYRHPLIRQSISPREIIAMVRELLHGLKLEDDARFDYELTETPQHLSFRLSEKVWW